MGIWAFLLPNLQARALTQHGGARKLLVVTPLS